MANQTGLQFTVKVGNLPDNTFPVAAFSHHEALNEPFCLQLELASLLPDIDFAAVLDQPCALQIWYDGVLQRRINGIVSRVVLGDTGFRRTRYQIEVRPPLWRLSLRRNARIFQTQTPQEIISILLQEAGVTDYAFSFKHRHAVREYCVQYRESDLAFIQRLAAEEGMFFFHLFDERAGRSPCLIFADDAVALETGPTLFFNLANQDLRHGAYVRRFHYGEAVRSNEVELKDYSFKMPAYALVHRQQARQREHQGEQASHHDYQHHSYQYYDYPGRYKQDSTGKDFAGYRLDALRADAQTGQGASNAPGLLPGQRFTLTEHPDGALNTAWQVVSIRHSGQQPQALEEEGGGGPTVYENQFNVIPAWQTWRSLIPHKPMVEGPQIATVVGPAGEEIYCDEHGRVKLQFPWDRYGASNDQSSCWVRVNQGWAGDEYGMMAIPRIGHEVIVEFLEGGPDQPIVTGRTYHATNRPPYALPANKTRTVLRTDTHQGEGFNELRFEDQAGQEEIYLHGQQDLNVQINHDATWHIGDDEHCKVDNQRVTQIKASDHLTVDGERREHIRQDYSLRVDATLHQKLGQALLVEAGQAVHLHAGQQVVIEAGAELTVKAGGSFIKLDPGGVTLVGPTIKLNAGGRAGTGSPWSGQLPILPAVVEAPTAPEAVTLTRRIASEQSLTPLEKDKAVTDTKPDANFAPSV